MSTTAKLAGGRGASHKGGQQRDSLFRGLPEQREEPRKRGFSRGGGRRRLGHRATALQAGGGARPSRAGAHLPPPAQLRWDLSVFYTGDRAWTARTEREPFREQATKSSAAREREGGGGNEIKG